MSLFLLFKVILNWKPACWRQLGDLLKHRQKGIWCGQSTKVQPVGHSIDSEKRVVRSLHLKQIWLPLNMNIHLVAYNKSKQHRDGKWNDKGFLLNQKLWFWMVKRICFGRKAKYMLENFGMQGNCSGNAVARNNTWFCYVECVRSDKGLRCCNRCISCMDK